jgi:flagellar biosynthesis protein FliQ
VIAALVVVGPWMGHEVGAFAERMFAAAAAQ